jgi:HAD superfamily hydrolase (TIGR01509 family)
MAIEAVIFDCDGTLVDSEPLARLAWERTLAPYGYAIGDAEYPGLIGLPYARVHGHFAERIDGLPEAGAFWEDYSAALFALIDGALQPFGDALSTVAELHARGVVVAVASSSPRARLDRALRRAGLSDAFAVSVAGDEIEHGKPAPDMFVAAAAAMAVPAVRCAVIEDSAPGVQAGLAAGMRTIGIAREPGQAERLAAADVVLERLTAEAVLIGADGAAPAASPLPPAPR